MILKHEMTPTIVEFIYSVGKGNLDFDKKYAFIKESTILTQ